jgi:hypothetical protein
MQKSDNPVIQEILDKLALLDYHKQIEPMKATLPGGNKLFMERINGSSKYLSHLRKMIYDVKFEKCYYYDGKIPENCFAIENVILRIEEQEGIGVQFSNGIPERFLKILNKPQPESQGIRIFLDDVLYASNVPFLKSDRVRDEILVMRHNGTMIYDVLKVVDPSGNVTKFYASPAVQKRMEIGRKVAHLQMMINPEAVYD